MNKWVINNKFRMGMKKLFTLCLSVALVLSGCVSENDITLQQGTEPLPADSLEEYRALNLDSWINKDAFITYDMLYSHFGSRLVWFIFHESYIEDGRGMYNDRYRYNFIEEDRYLYVLDIYELPEDIDLKNHVASYYPETTSIENKADLRSAKSSGYYRIGNMWYCYSDALLKEICWETETHRFNLRIDKIQSYDLDSGTFVAKLLREDSAEEAIEEFNASIRQSLVWRKFCRYWLPWILVAVISCAAIGTVYLILRRKAKKKRALAD